MSILSGTDELVSAARAARRSGQPVTVDLRNGSARTYLPRPYGWHFDLPAGTDLSNVNVLLDAAADALRAGDGDEAIALLRWVETTGLHPNTEAGRRAQRLHAATHLYRCCPTHDRHTVPHRGCILR
jgi:hypothetical protein